MRQKKKIKLKKSAIILIIMLPIIILIITVLLYIKSKELKIVYKKEVRVPINEKLYNTDSIESIRNGKIHTKKELIDTKRIGEKQIDFEVENHFKKIKKYNYKVIVYDDELPKIVYKDKIETEEGKEIDLLKDVNVSDNSKEDIKVNIEGEYDFNKSGEYELYYTAKDSSGNEAKEKFTLIVTKKKEKEEKKKNPKSGTTTEQTSFTSKGNKITVKNGITYIDGYLIVNKTYSLPKTYAPGLTNDTKENFNKMKNAAKEDNLDIYISSGYRSYSKQSTIYDRYVKQDGKEEADAFSARPGHSEHQSGLAVDLNIINDSFANTKEAKWLAENCYKYGFILRYPKGKSNETGYKYEPWHFRYVGVDLASKLYNNGDWITMETYFGVTSKYK